MSVGTVMVRQPQRGLTAFQLSDFLPFSLGLVGSCDRWWQVTSDPTASLVLICHFTSVGVLEEGSLGNKIHLLELGRELNISRSGRTCKLRVGTKESSGSLYI